MSMLGAGGAYVRIHIFANQGSFIMRKTLLLIAATILLSVLPDALFLLLQQFLRPVRIELSALDGAFVGGAGGGPAATVGWTERMPAWRGSVSRTAR